MKNKLFIFLFTSLIIINSYSMEENNEMQTSVEYEMSDSNGKSDSMDECEKESKKRTFAQLEDFQQDSQEDSKTERAKATEDKKQKHHYEIEDQVFEKFKSIGRNLKNLPIKTDDIITLIQKRINTNKAFEILSELPYELVLHTLDIFIEQQLSLIINRITSSKANKHYFSNQENPTVIEKMEQTLNDLFNVVNGYFKDLYVNLIILIRLIDRLKSQMNPNNEENDLSEKDKQLLKLQNVCQIIKQRLEKPKFKKKIRSYFNNMILDKFNIFENPNLLKAFEKLFLIPNSKFSLKPRWNFLLNHLLEHPTKIPHDLKILCGHWLAHLNRTQDLYKLIATHNCIADTCQTSHDCQDKNDYIVTNNPISGFIAFPQFKQGTLLMTAIYFKAFDVARWLIQNKIQIDYQDKKGDDALIYCIEGLGAHKITIQDILRIQDLVRLLLEAWITKNLSKAINRLNQFGRAGKFVTKFDPNLNRNIGTIEESADEESIVFNNVKSNILRWLYEASRSINNLTPLVNGQMNLQF